MRRLGVPPRHAVVVGDTPDDINAARHADLEAIAMDSGGFGPDALRAAGAIAVYRSLLTLLDELDTSPLVDGDGAPGVASSTPSPGPNL